MAWATCSEALRRNNAGHRGSHAAPSRTRRGPLAAPQAPSDGMGFAPCRPPKFTKFTLARYWRGVAICAICDVKERGLRRPGGTMAKTGRVGQRELRFWSAPI